MTLVVNVPRVRLSVIRGCSRGDSDPGVAHPPLQHFNPDDASAMKNRATVQLAWKGRGVPILSRIPG
jgi:hypothetical protein